MKTKHLLLLTPLFFSGLMHAATVAQWTFEGDVLTPSSGTGTAINIGSTSSAFAAGNGGGRGWNTAAYPAQSTASGTAGVQFAVPTVGFEGITISFDHRASGTASRWAQLEYTTDVTAVTPVWVVAGNNSGGISPHDTFYSFSFDLSTITAIDENPNFAFRIVSIFSPVAFDQNASLADYAANSAYMRANALASFTPDGGIGTGDYGAAGTWRFDNVTVTAAIPEPAAALLGGLGLLALLRRRRG